MFKAISKSVVLSHRLQSKAHAIQHTRNLAIAAAQKQDAHAHAVLLSSSTSNSETFFQTSRLKIHDLQVLHDSTGSYVYEARLSCDDQNEETTEFIWNIRFTKEEYDNVFSLPATLGTKVKATIDSLLVGTRGKARRGSSTLVVASNDRSRRLVWRLFQGLVLVIAAVVAAWIIKYLLRTIIDDEWTNARLWLMTGIVLLSTTFMYGAFDYFVLQMFPTSTLLRYHRANIQSVRSVLEQQLASADFYTQIQKDEKLASFLRFSPQALRRRFSRAHREGYVSCKVVSRSEFEADRGVQLDGVCCRCTVEFGCRGRNSWHFRWAVLRSTGIAFFRHPFDKSPTHTILFDTQFYVSKGRSLLSSKIDRSGSVTRKLFTLVVAGSNAVCEIATVHLHDRDGWHDAITFATSSPSASSWVKGHRFGSFAPRRLPSNVAAGIAPEQLPKTSPPAARWLLNGRGYYALLAEEFSKAKREIFITGWFL